MVSEESIQFNWCVFVTFLTLIAALGFDSVSVNGLGLIAGGWTFTEGALRVGKALGLILRVIVLRLIV